MARLKHLLASGTSCARDERPLTRVEGEGGQTACIAYEGLCIDSRQRLRERYRRCISDGGIVCMTGIAGNRWTLDGFNPMERIPTAAYLTSYAGENGDFMRTPLTELAAQIKAGELKLEVDKIFTFDQTVEMN